MQTLENRIVAAARGWLSTLSPSGPLEKNRHAQGRGGLFRPAGWRGGRSCDLRGKGGLPLSRFDETNYGHLPDGERLRAALSAHLYPVRGIHIPIGGILLIALDGVPRHLAIASNFYIPGVGMQPGMIHAYAQARKVVEHARCVEWRERIVAVFTIPPQ